MKYRIVSDSSSNILHFDSDIAYTTVPLKIRIDEEEFVDADGLDLVRMIEKMEASQTPSRTSCPHVQEWLDAYEGYDCVFAITISGQLSGSFAAAYEAGQEYMQSHPEAKVFVIDSRETGSGMELIIEKLVELMDENKSFEEIRDTIVEYQKNKHLLFVLQSLSNLAKNGRVNPAIAKIAGMIGLKFVGQASPEGTIVQRSISRGMKKALKSTYDGMKDFGYHGGKVRINNCLNEEDALELKKLVLEEYPEADVKINSCTGLCSFYAERGGLIIGFEV